MDRVPHGTPSDLPTRRSLLRGFVLGSAAALLPSWLQTRETSASRSAATFRFEPVSLTLDDDHRVAVGHTARALISWGDPVLPGAPAFDPQKVNANDQARQFGTCCDFTMFLPLPLGSTNSEHGLLCVNHEFSIAALMWEHGESTRSGSLDPARIRTEMAAQGHSVIEVKRDAGVWRVIENSRFARRITATTPIAISGPARGHKRMRTKADPKGELVLGTFANCAGGSTPWGTALLAEENIENYFQGECGAVGYEEMNHRRLGLTLKPTYQWCRVDERFNFELEPDEPNRFGWIVEFDPFDPTSQPVKRTALGRMKHECAKTVLASDGRLVVYMGDDEEFEHLYRFVSRQAYDADTRAANRNLLDEGTLSVARFSEDGTCEWIPLIHGVGPLTAANGFADQGEVLIDARRAATQVGATPLDRPEDVEVDPASGRVYVTLTNNAARTPSQIDAVSPRAFNAHGQVLELTPPTREAGVAHEADRMTWSMLLVGGDPANGRLNNPDNAAFDAKHRLWIATDQGSEQMRRGIADGLWACETGGPGRGTAEPFYAAPRGAEVCGPCFTPDGRTLFLAVQHPGAGRVSPEGPVGTFQEPATRWPDFDAARPPRCSIVAITKDDGGAVGG